MDIQTLEGSWEEIRSHDAELAGHRVRLTVIDNDLAIDTTTASTEGASGRQPTLAEVFEGRIGNVSFDPPDLSVRTKEAFGKIILQKHRNGTL